MKKAVFGVIYAAVTTANAPARAITSSNKATGMPGTFCFSPNRRNSRPANAAPTAAALPRIAPVTAGYERSSLLPLATEGFPYAEVIYPLIVDGHGRVKVKTNWYSAPLSPGWRTTAVVGPSEIEIRHDNQCAARHPRCYGRGHQILNLEHYLDVLEKKPGAMAGSTPLQQWRLARVSRSDLGSVGATRWQERRDTGDDYAGSGRKRVGMGQTDNGGRRGVAFGRNGCSRCAAHPEYAGSGGTTALCHRTE